MNRVFAILLLISAGCSSEPNGAERAPRVEAPQPLPAETAKPESDAAVVAKAPTPDAQRLLPKTPIRLAWIHDHDLLASERRAMDRIENAIRKSSGADSMEAESRSGPLSHGIRDFFAHSTDDVTLPSPWATAPIVVVIEVGAPVQDGEKRLGVGPGGFLLFLPPNPVPVLRARVTAPSHDGTATQRWKILQELLGQFVGEHAGEAR